MKNIKNFYLKIKSFLRDDNEFTSVSSVFNRYGVRCGYPVIVNQTGQLFAITSFRHEDDECLARAELVALTGEDNCLEKDFTIALTDEEVGVRNCKFLGYLSTGIELTLIHDDLKRERVLVVDEIENCYIISKYDNTQKCIRLYYYQKDCFETLLNGEPALPQLRFKR